MVADKIREIKEDSSWKLWGTVVAVITLMLLYVQWQNGQTMSHIDLRLQPLVVAVQENTDARKQGGRYTDTDAIRDLSRIRAEMTNCKSESKAEDNRLHTRIDQLFQKMFEFHSAHPHELMLNNQPVMP